MTKSEPAPQATGRYFNQKPPGLRPELFAPGIISTKYYEHSAPAFSPDGQTVLWTVIYERQKPARLLAMQLQDGRWTPPAPPAFADTTADEFYPSFSADGKKLYFSSRRKVPAGYKNAGLRIWVVEKSVGGWGNPVPFDTTASTGEDYAMSMTRTGDTYFAIRRQNGRVFDLVTSRKVAQRYQPPELLPYNINTDQTEDGAFIAPDGSYLIFESSRPGSIAGSTDLYISFRNKSGQWGIARNMGPAVNSSFTERFAKLSPDGQYLFFGSDRDRKPGEEGTDVYWVDAKVIEELKKEYKFSDANSIGEEEKGILPALYGNDKTKLADLLGPWVQRHPDDEDGFVAYISALRKSGQFATAENVLTLKGSKLPSNTAMMMEVALITYGMNKRAEAEQYLLAQLPPAPEQRIHYTQLAQQLYLMKQYTESAALYEVALNIQETGADYYNLACSWSLGGQKDKAFEALDNAANNGYTARRDYEHDGDLASLKSDARWAALMEKLDAPFNTRTPYKRAHHEMVYDEHSNAVLMTGGSTPLNGGQSFKLFNDLWKYTNSVWSKAGNAGDERSGIRLAYDTKRNKIYSFGGFTSNNQSSGQLRVLENNGWKILADLPDMKAAEPGFVYDIARDKLIAFGGSAARGLVNNTTWEWDGAAWKKFEGKSPNGRQAFAMVYDSKRHKAILYGGADGNGTIFNDGVWEFDGTVWKNIVTENNPGPRISPGYAFDSKRNLLILFGGISQGALQNDLWAWDGQAWKLLSTEGPPKRTMGYLAYDKVRDKIILFGGRLGWPNDADDTWEWDGVKWTAIQK